MVAAHAERSRHRLRNEAAHAERSRRKWSGVEGVEREIRPSEERDVSTQSVRECCEIVVVAARSSADTGWTC